jgi:hypothetical protein
MSIIQDTAPLFYLPDDEDIPVSKYMDLTKFLSLICRKSIFFCRLDKLEDTYEGQYPKKTYERVLNWPVQKHNWKCAIFDIFFKMKMI